MRNVCAEYMIHKVLVLSQVSNTQQQLVANYIMWRKEFWFVLKLIIEDLDEKVTANL